MGPRKAGKKPPVRPACLITRGDKASTLLICLVPTQRWVTRV
jgi:hypothetical protein